MRASQAVSIAILILLSVASVTNARTLDELKDLVQKNLKSYAAQPLVGRNLKHTYFLLKASQELKLNADAGVCANLNKLKVADFTDPEDQLFFLDSSRIAKCNHKEEKNVNQYVAKYSQSNLVTEYFYAVLLGLDFGLIKKGDNVCNRAVEFLTSDGTTIINLNDKGTKSMYYTPKMLEIITRCETKPGIVKDAVKNLLLNTYPIYKNGLALIEGDSIFTTTANVVNWLVASKEFNNQDFQSKLPALAFFIQAHAQYISDPKDIFAYSRVGNKISDIPFFELSNQVFDLSNKAQWQLKGNFYNVFFQNYAAIKQALGAVTATATIEPTGEKVTFNLVNDAFSSNFGANINSPGYYKVNVKVTSLNRTFSYDTQFLVRKKIQVSDVRFDVAQSSNRPAQLANEVKDGKISNEVLKSNQNGFIFVSFKVTGIDNPAEAVLRLAHPQYKDATGTLVATLNKNTYLFEAAIDLGNSAVILPYSGEYKLNLYVSDPYAENAVEWTLSRFQLTFTKSQQVAPAKESDLKSLPEIRHQFPEERKKPNPLITMVFVVLPGLAVIFYLLNLAKINVNLGRFPSTGLGPVFGLLFTALIFGLVGILTLFFFKINLFQTLALLGLAVIPTLVLGNLTFRHLVQESAEPNVAVASSKRSEVVSEVSEEDMEVKVEKKSKAVKAKVKRSKDD